MSEETLLPVPLKCIHRPAGSWCRLCLDRAMSFAVEAAFVAVKCAVDREGKEVALPILRYLAFPGHYCPIDCKCHCPGEPECGCERHPTCDETNGAGQACVKPMGHVGQHLAAEVV
jgi:hypothetical protein